MLNWAIFTNWKQTYFSSWLLVFNILVSISSFIFKFQFQVSISSLIFKFQFQVLWIYSYNKPFYYTLLLWWQLILGDPDQIEDFGAWKGLIQSKYKDICKKCLILVTRRATPFSWYWAFLTTARRFWPYSGQNQNWQTLSQSPGPTEGFL